MKYFTPELYIRGNSPDAELVDGIEEEWERRLRRYDRRWNKIKSSFPESVRRFDAAHVCLHDGELLHMARQGDRFVLIVQTEPPARNLVILTFTLTGAPQILTDALPDTLRGPRPRWLYEEFDLDRHRRRCFEVFFDNGWMVKLRFNDFQFLVAETVTPGVNGEAVRARKAAARA